MVSVARPAKDAASGPQVRLIPRLSAGPGPLVHQSHLGAGVHVGVDLMSPIQWHTVSFWALHDASGPLLRALIGDEAADDLRGGGPLCRASAARGVAVDLAGAAPWLRVAVVDALDRWLQVPLEQSLVDAERGVSRGQAARTLPDGPARALLIGDALRLARRASHDLVAFLRGLGSHSHVVPNQILLALKRLVDGYTRLVDEVAGPDRKLAAVLEGWQQLSRRVGGADRPEPGGGRSTAGPRPPILRRTGGRLTSMIDPRQIRARVFALSADPTSPEVALSKAELGDSDAVLVRVPAFGRGVDPDIKSRLMVRLVDRRSGDLKGHALLNMAVGPLGADDAPFFEATVPLCGLSVSDVRADVFDALSDLPPARTDDDSALQEVRRAVVFLSEWRQMLGVAQMPAATAGLARRLRELASRLAPGGAGASDPLFAGGPSGAELEALAEEGDDELLSRLRGDRALIGNGPLGVTQGAGGLLVAEVVAAHVSPAA